MPVIVELSADEQRLLKALDRIVREQGRVEDRLRDTGRAAEQAGDEMVDAFRRAQEADKNAFDETLRKLRGLGPEGRRAASQISQSLSQAAVEAEGGFEGLLEELERLNPTASEAADRIRDELASAAAASEGRFQDIIGELRQVGDAGERAADDIERALISAGAESEEAFRDVAQAARRYSDRLQELNARQRAGAISAEQMAIEQERARRAFNDSSRTVERQNSLIGRGVDQIGKYAVAAVGVGTVLEGLRETWREIVDEQDRGLRGLQATELTDRRLLQVSDSREEFTQRRQLADDLSVQFGVDRNTVREVLFSAISEGFEGAVPDIVRASQVISPDTAASVGGQVPTLFGGRQALPTLEAISGTLTAARQSRVDFEELGRFLPNAAEGTRILGASFEETSAALAALASDFGNVSTAADRIKAFSIRVADDERLKGQDLVETIEELQSFSEDDRAGILGNSQEVNVAYQALTDELERIRQFSSAIRADRTATQGGAGALLSKVQIAEQDEQFAAIRAERQSEIQKEVTETVVKGVEGAQASQVDNEIRRRITERGTFFEKSIGLPTVSATAGRAAVAAGFDADTASDFGERFGIGATGTVGVLGRLTGAIFRLNENLERIEEESDVGDLAPDPPPPTTPALSNVGT